MVLLPLVCSKVDVPVIAAGGIVDGRSMAAAFALGAEGVQMGTRMVSVGREPGAFELEGRHPRRARRPTRCSSTASAPARRCGRCAPRRPRAFEKDAAARTSCASSATRSDLYFGGDMEASIALSGQVAGRIDEVKPVAQVIAETVAEFEEVTAELGRRYGAKQLA